MAAAAAPAAAKPPAAAVAQRAAQAPRASADLEAIFAEPEEETPLELEEVVAIGTDPVLAQGGTHAAFLGGDTGPEADPFRPIEPSDTTVALFGESDDLSGSHGSMLGDDGAGDLDDLFADLVKD
jgi:hypothetical protein